MKEEILCKHENRHSRTLDCFDATEMLQAPFSVRLYSAVEQRQCSDCGAILSHTIPRLAELVAVVAIFRACDPIKLNGSEIRFLRKSLNRKAKDFANEISVSAEQFSRFENDKVTISESYEKLLRAAVCLGHFELTGSVEVHPTTLFSMKIRSARCAEEKPSFDLHFGHKREQMAVVNGDSARGVTFWHQMENAV